MKTRQPKTCIVLIVDICLIITSQSAVVFCVW